MKPRILGAIFAGGRASRFGSDKAAALYRGEPLIAHVAAWLTPIVDGLVLCGGSVTFAGTERIEDRPMPGLGPLGALCGALHHAREGGFDRVLSSGCDTPAVPVDLIARLLAGRPASHVSELPLIGVWPASDADRLERHLSATTDRSMRGWTRVIGAEAVRAGAPIANINAPADLAALEGLHGGAG